MALSKADIQGVDDIKRASVTIDDWGGEVCIRALSVRDRQVFVKLYGEGAPADPPIAAEVWLVVASVCDKDGNKLFDESDAEWLADKSAQAIQDIGLACLELNGLTESGMDDAEKN